MKNPIFLILALLLLLTTACEEKEENKACACIPFAENNESDSFFELAFHEAYMVNEFGDFINDIFVDTVNFQVDSIGRNAPGKMTRSEFGNKFRFNITQDYQLLEDPKIGYSKANDTARVNEILNFYLDENWLGEDQVTFVWGAEPVSFHGEKTAYYVLYALRTSFDNYKARISSKDIVSANLQKDLNMNETQVMVTMTPEGRAEWAKMTTENIRKFIAITHNNKVLTAPMINSPITGGISMISGEQNKRKAQELVDLINCEAYSREVGMEQLRKEATDCKE